MDFERILARAVSYTNRNMHQTAVLYVAQQFGYKRIAAAVRGVIAIQDARGHMDKPMIDMMQILRAELYQAVEAQYGAGLRQRVYMCF